MATPPGIIGYTAVVIPDRGWYQGFFLTDLHTEVAKQIVADARRSVAEYRAQGGPTTLIPLEGVSEDDQAVVASLSAALVEVAVAGDILKVGAVSRALALLIGYNYFWVCAEHDGIGTKTRVQMLPVTTTDAARALIETLPEVAACKRQHAAGSAGKT